MKKTSCKDVLQIRLEDDLKTSWRRLEDVLENKKCLLDYWYQIYILVYWYHQFKGSSELNSNKIILQLSWNNINFSKFMYSCFQIILVIIIVGLIIFSFIYLQPIYCSWFYFRKKLHLRCFQRVLKTPFIKLLERFQCCSLTFVCSKVDKL